MSFKLPLASSWEILKKRQIYSIDINNFKTKLINLSPLTGELLYEIFGKEKYAYAPYVYFIDNFENMKGTWVYPVIDKYINSICEISPSKLEQIHLDILKKIKQRLETPENMPNQWRLISSRSVDYFNKWLLLDKLYEHFQQLEVDREERLEFWKKYFHYFKRIAFYRQYGEALIIETDRHTLVEFNGPSGGKFHLFEKENLNIDMIEKERKKRSHSYMISNVLKNKYKSEIDMSHSGNGWMHNFKRALLQYEYYME